MSLQPFLKWVGGKRKLIPEILARIPAAWKPERDLYVEPFLGGGAAFFALVPKHALLNDSNFQLIALYHNVQRNLPGLWDSLNHLRAMYAVAAEETYYNVRATYNAIAARQESDQRQAARLLFLNKTCFNGLYRVNAHGDFNAPWGKNPKAGFPTLEHLQFCSAVLQAAQRIFLGDFATLHGTFDPKGALIYCDPPYVPVSKTANFTAYTPQGFTYADQLRLVVAAARWRDQGAHVILSQAADETLVDQYRRFGFRADLVQAPRAINSKASARGPVGEYLIY